MGSVRDSGVGIGVEEERGNFKMVIATMNNGCAEHRRGRAWG